MLQLGCVVFLNALPIGIFGVATLFGQPAGTDLAHFGRPAPGLSLG
jgi:hypothetical protein